MKLNNLKAFATRHKDMLITTAAIVVFTAIALDSSDVLAVKNDAMKDSVTHIESLLRGNVSRVVVGVGVLAGFVYSLMKSSLVPVGISVGSGVAYGGMNMWVDSAYTALI